MKRLTLIYTLTLTTILSTSLFGQTTDSEPSSGNGGTAGEIAAPATLNLNIDYSDFLEFVKGTFMRIHTADIETKIYEMKQAGMSEQILLLHLV